MLQQLSSPATKGITSQHRVQDFRARKHDDGQSRDVFVPSNGVEHRADLMFKQASRNQHVEKSRQSEFEELTSDFPGREGYDKNFLGRTLDLPKVDASWQDRVATLIGKPNESELKYTNFSIVMNKERRQPFFTAVNIDGANVVDVPRDGDWTIDSRIPREHQLGNEAYKGNNIDRGHQVRRRDAAWGPDAHRGSNDTFSYTNASLQHSALNQKEWLQLENHVLDTAKAEDKKITVLTGPVMRDSDPKWNNGGKVSPATQMPQEFWKVVVWNDPEEGLKGSAFVLSQKDFVNPRGLFQADFDPGRFEVYQVPLDKLEEMTHLDFGNVTNSQKEPKQINRPQDAVVL